MDNVTSNQQRAEFYANRLLCALRHLSNILAHMQRIGGYPPVEVQEVQTLHGNIKAIYILIVQLPIMQGTPIGRKLIFPLVLEGQDTEYRLNNCRA